MREKSTTILRRRGWGLIQMIGSIFAGSLILGACVPLFLAGQREADIGIARSVMTAQAREVSGRFREDVRQASTIRVTSGGGELHLSLPRVRQTVSDRVIYRRTTQGLQRELIPGDDTRPAEKYAYGTPLRQCRFSRSDKAVEARLTFASRVYGRDVRYALDCVATPRSAL